MMNISNKNFLVRKDNLQLTQIQYQQIPTNTYKAYAPKF